MSLSLWTNNWPRLAPSAPHRGPEQLSGMPGALLGSPAQPSEPWALAMLEVYTEFWRTEGRSDQKGRGVTGTCIP